MIAANISWRIFLRPRLHMLTRHFSLQLSSPQTYMDLTQKFYESLTVCSSLKSLPTTQMLHAQLFFAGLNASVFLQNHLLNTYSNCNSLRDAFSVFCEIDYRNVYSWNTIITGFINSGKMKEAGQLFAEMPERDSVSWNSMMSGYFRDGKSDSTLRIFISMVRDSVYVIDQYSLSCAMKACGSLGYHTFACQLHALVEKFKLKGDVSVEAAILDMYIKTGALDSAEQVFLRMHNPSFFSWNSMIYCYSKLYGVGSSLDLFLHMPQRNGVSWNMIISILSQHGFVDQSLRLFVEMWSLGFRSNSMTYASALRVCCSIKDMDWGSHLHARIVRMETNVDVFTGSGLIDMYWKCGRLDYALRVFNSLREHNAVCWTSLIMGLAHFGLEQEALKLFNEMRKISISPDDFTLATVLVVCAGQKDISAGQQLHAQTIKLGMDSSIPVGNAVMTMYAKCGSFLNSNRLFKWMPVKDVISWTTMITACSQVGDIDTAQDFFNKMPLSERNVVTWNTMLATYIQHGFWEEGMKLLISLLKKGSMPDCITFTISISACADLAVVRLGIQLISQAEKRGFSSNVSVATSVVTFYSKCGVIEQARRVFDSINTKNLVSFNAMLAGYAQNGQGKKVVETFENMLELGFRPDHVSYVSVLSGCSHSGLISEGQHYFGCMITDHNISPMCEHYVCMVDLLGRAGMLNQARDLIERMPIKPNVDIWKALLSACRTHGNTMVAEVAIKKLLELGVEDSGTFILQANLYSDSGKLENVTNVRKLMRVKGIQKNPGCSWIEVNNRVHVFTADDNNHPQINDIYRILEEVSMKLEDNGNYLKDSFVASPDIQNARCYLLLS